MPRTRVPEKRTAKELLPLLGEELRDLFITRITDRLVALAVHKYCQRGRSGERRLHTDFEDSLIYFLNCYLPLVTAANHLCALDEELEGEMRRLWQDLFDLISAHLHQGNGSEDEEMPPRAIDRVYRFDREDPIGKIMIRELETTFSRRVRQWKPPT